MKGNRWRPRAALVLLVVAVALLGACAKGKEASGDYYCPMHPTYVSDRPGDCPICNMRLVPRTAPAAETRQLHSGHGTAGGAADSAAAYTCPMHPEVVSDRPGSCPICHMDLVPKAVERPAGVEGYAAVTLDATRRQLAGVETAAATSGRLVRTVRTSGTVLPDEGRMQHVHVKAGGYVEKLYVNVTGQKVRRGEPMLVLYSPELLASQEELLRAKRAADEAQSAASPGARTSAEELLAAARRRLLLLDIPPEFIAEVERSGRPQRTVTVHAHAGGYVTSKDVIEGQLVEPGSELFTINDLERVWVEAAFYESEAPLVHAGERATVTLPYDAAVTLEGRASYVYPSIDPDSRTLRVRFEFANPSLQLRPSMYVDVVLEVEAPEGILVPESAVLDSGERQIVFVEAASNRFEPRQVQLGLRSGGLVLVHAGVGAGERVVVRANFLLDSESRLQGSMAAPGGEEHRGHAP